MSTASGTDEAYQDRRPHLVMAVGNLVVGDSRVEKAAITARDLGYKVTVVGIRRRTVQQVSFIDGDIPVIRPPVGNEHHLRVADSITRREAFLEKRRRQINRLPQRLKRPAYIAHRIGVRSRDAGVKASAKFGRSWRTLWPHLVDYEATFFDAFRALEPDLIHVHDRHPLPGAAKYSSWAERTPGIRPVKWLYDAHEFVPTQHLPPPVEHQQAWIAVESECIQQADAVVTVTDKIADLIKQRHRLDTTPAVVRNLPSLKQAEQNDLRSDVRSELGLAPDVPIAVYAGGITPQRGLRTLLDAQPMVPGLHVAIICKNDEERRSALRAQASKLGTEDRLHFLDYVPASHVSRFISTANLGISALLPSPAHEEAAPTKVSEYLHAHLPVVVSDMRAQAERVRRLGFGAVYPSGNANLMAKTLVHVLANPSEFTRRITEKVILDNSWESDAPVLERIWQRLCPGDRQLQRPPKQEPYLSLITVNGRMVPGWESAFAHLQNKLKIYSTLPRISGIQGDLTEGRFMLSEEGLRFLEFWRKEVSRIKGVFYEEPVSLVDGWDPGLTAGALVMSNKPAIRMLTGNPVYDIDRLRSNFPYHWLHEVSDDLEAQLRFEFTSLQESIRSSDRCVVTNSLATNWSLGSTAIFIPPEMTVFTPDQVKRCGSVNVGWRIDEKRSSAEINALDDLNSLRSPKVNLRELSDSDLCASLSGLDIFVDSLSSNILTHNGLRAIALGCVVITGESAARSTGRFDGFASEPPTVESSPKNLVGIIESYLEDDRKLLIQMRESVDFARKELTAGSISNRLSNLSRVDIGVV